MLKTDSQFGGVGALGGHQCWQERDSRALPCPSSMWGRRQPWVSVDREVGSPHTAESPCAFILDFPASRPVRSQFLLLMSHPYYGIFVIAAQVNEGSLSIIWKSGLNGVCGSKSVVCKSVHFCITLGKLLHFFVPQVSHQKKIGLLIELCVVLRMKYYSWNV